MRFETDISLNKFAKTNKRDEITLRRINWKLYIYLLADYLVMVYLPPPRKKKNCNYSSLKKLPKNCCVATYKDINHHISMDKFSIQFSLNMRNKKEIS